MKIVCCIHSLAGGGAEHLMAGLASGLAQRHQVTLLTLDQPANDLYSVADNVERVGANLMGRSATPLHALANNLRRIRVIRALIRQRNPDVVLTFCDQMNVATLLACRRLRIPTVAVELTDPRFHRLPAFWRYLRPLAYRRASAVVAISQVSLPTVSRLHGRSAVFIPPAVDPIPSDVSPDRPPADRHRLAALGRLSFEKRFDWLIKAFAQIADRHPAWTLEIVGQGPMRENLQALVQELGLDEQVRLRGRLPDIWSFLAGAEAFAFSSQYEGTPVALLEAMSAGLPVIAIDCDSGINEVIRHDVNGLLVGNDITALAVGLDNLLSDSALRRRLGQEARQVAASYGWPQFIERYERLLGEVARK